MCLVRCAKSCLCLADTPSPTNPHHSAVSTLVWRIRLNPNPRHCSRLTPPFISRIIGNVHSRLTVPHQVFRRIFGKKMSPTLNFHRYPPFFSTDTRPCPPKSCNGQGQQGNTPPPQISTFYRIPSTSIPVLADNPPFCLGFMSGGFALAYVVSSNVFKSVMTGLAVGLSARKKKPQTSYSFHVSPKVHVSLISLLESAGPFQAADLGCLPHAPF